MGLGDCYIIGGTLVFWKISDDDDTKQNAHFSHNFQAICRM
jgi:hypothetical protein